MNKKALAGVLGGLGAAGVAIGYFGTKRGRFAERARHLRDEAVRRADELRSRAAQATGRLRADYDTRRLRAFPPADLNRASRERLLLLAGITELLVDRIIENRPYRNKIELVSRVIVPQDVYDAIKDELRVEDTGESVKVA